MNHIPSTGPINTNGLTVNVQPITTIDSAKVIVKSFTGGINNVSAAGLAEVEVNARVSSVDLVNISNNNITYCLYNCFINFFPFMDYKIFGFIFIIINANNFVLFFNAKT